MPYYNLDDTCYFSTSINHVFYETFTPGSEVPYSGIYRCTGCGSEIACNKGDVFPPENNDQHTSGEPIRWKLLVHTK